jgi:type III restriction enzyme
MESITASDKDSIRSTVKYDLIGKLAQESNLTRRTIAGILQGIQPDTFNQYPTNPEDFIAKATRLINEQKATVIVEHLAYDTIAGTHSLDIFTQEKRTLDLSKAGDKLNRHIYEEVVVYAKLPKGFFIPTPVGDYNPDWAISFKEGAVKHVYFIAETKGSMSSMELRKLEQCRIDCAGKFFGKITSGQVKYGVVDSYGKLMELVK